MQSKMNGDQNDKQEKDGVRPEVRGSSVIKNELPRDTLEQIAQILELMQYLDLSKGLDPQAQLGLFQIHQLLSESLQHLSEHLREPVDNNFLAS